MGFIRDFLSMSVVVPAQPKRKKLQVSYHVRPRRPPWIYVEYLDENGAVIRDVKPVKPVTPSDAGAPQKPGDIRPEAPAPAATTKKHSAVPYTSHDASTQTDYFWCPCQTKPLVQSQAQPAKKQSKNKESSMTEPESSNPAKAENEAKSRTSKGSRSEADVLALLEQATRGKSNTSKGPKAGEASKKVEISSKKSERKDTEKKQQDKKQQDKKQPDKKQPDKKQLDKKQPDKKQPDKKQPEKKQPVQGLSGKKQSGKQRATPSPLKEVRFTHLPRFRDPHRNPASSSSSSATDESNTDFTFAASMAQAPPPGYVSQMQEPELYGTPAQRATYQELRNEDDMIRRSMRHTDYLGKVRNINEEAAAERSDEATAQQWLREMNAEASQAAATWLGQREAVRSQERGIASYSEHDQMREADEREAARWVEQRAKERQESLANRNNRRSDIKIPHHRELKAEGYRKSPSPDEVVWDSTHNTNWTRPSEWKNISGPQKSSLSRSDPKIWDDQENNADSQERRVSFASPDPPADSDPRKDTEGHFLNEMDMNASHISPYRKHPGFDPPPDSSLYRPHSRHRSAYEYLPEPIFIMNPRGAAARSTRKSSDRNSSATVVRQPYEMSGALHESDARANTKKKNKKKVHYEAPSVASVDSNDEDPTKDMVW
ncbi:hypothetical protein MMC34_005257 [Xylographa carneopallida]|nr:hypothetical protein [Xylographa carneopallida]